MFRFFIASMMMIFSLEFWEYALPATVIFFTFSFVLWRVSIRSQKLYLLKKRFYLCYPLIALFSIIPAVILIQCFVADKNFIHIEDLYISAGIILNTSAYFLLNVIAGVLWSVIGQVRYKRSDLDD